MRKRKTSKLLIDHSFGSPNSCSKCSLPDVSNVVHENIDWIDLRSYIKELDEEQRYLLKKKYTKQCDERFLCRSCFDLHYYHNDDRYDPYTNQADFTSVYIRDWKNKDYLTVEDAVAKVQDSNR